MLWISIKNLRKPGGKPLRSFPIDRDEIIIGRGRDCTIRVLDPQVSAMHAIVVNGRLLIDKNSTNGVYVGSERVSCADLTPGLEFRLGDTVFVVSDDVADDAEEPPTARVASDVEDEAEYSARQQHFAADEHGQPGGARRRAAYGDEANEDDASEEDHGGAAGSRRTLRHDAATVSGLASRLGRASLEDERRSHSSPSSPAGAPRSLSRPSLQRTLQRSRTSGTALYERGMSTESDDTDRRRASPLEVDPEAKADFIARVSHELRTPMNGVIGLSQLLRQSAQNLTDDQKEIVENITESGTLLLQLVGDLLDFSKIQKGKLELFPQPVSLARCVTSVERVLRLEMQKKGIHFKKDVDSRLPALVLADDKRLQQVLLNLLSNAVKFTPARGAITVVVELVSIGARETRGDSDVERDEETGADEEEGGGARGQLEALVSFQVVDTGCGIPPERQRAIFEGYSQASAAVYSQYGGTGLGLSISTQLVRLMGGELAVDSRVGEGSTFFFTVPFALPGGRVAVSDAVDEAEAQRERARATEAATASLHARADATRLAVRALAEEAGSAAAAAAAAAASAASIHEHSAPARLAAAARSLPASPNPLHYERMGKEEPLSARIERKLRAQRAAEAEDRRARGIQGRGRHAHAAATSDDEEETCDHRRRPSARGGAAEEDEVAGVEDEDREPGGEPAPRAEPEPVPLFRSRSRSDAGLERKDVLPRGLSSRARETKHLGAAVQALHATGPSSPRATRGSLRVLIAEDNVVNQKVAQRHIESAGHRVTVAGNGEEAVAHWSAPDANFDVILMDVQMPVMDGPTAAQHIRAMEAERGVPEHERVHIIALTAHTGELYRQQCIKSGMNDYVSKPIDWGAMREKLARLGGSASAPGESSPHSCGGSSPVESARGRPGDHRERRRPNPLARLKTSVFAAEACESGGHPASGGDYDRRIVGAEDDA